jgi:diguanylate cyclase (GGDEF)-like protein
MLRKIIRAGRKINNFLGGPRKPLDSVEKNRQTRLLSWVQIFIIIFGLIMMLGTLRIHTPRASTKTITSVTLFLLAVLYGINRLGYFRFASISTIIVITLAIFIAGIPNHGPSDAGMLYFIVIPILFSVIFLPLKLSVIYGTAVIIGMFVFDAAHPQLPGDSVPTSTTVILVGLLLVASRHQDLVEKDRQRELRESEQRFRTLVHHTPESILLIDTEKREILEYNHQAKILLPGIEKFIYPCPLEKLKVFGDSFYSQLSQGIDLSVNGKDVSREIKLPKEGGQGIICETNFIKIPKTNGRRVVISMQDITDRKERELKLYFLANHDSLTKLPNRNLLNDRLEAAVNRSKRNSTFFAVLFMDLDNFKHINDVFGHPMGDHLLIELAERFKQHLRATDTVSRLGGDEFAVIIEELDSPLSVIPVVRKLISITTKPILLKNRELSVTTSIGISIYPQDGEVPEELLKNADAALYFTKASGKNSFSMYENYMTRDIANRLELAQYLRYALVREELYLEYQPQVKLETQEIVGVEALVRWRHPERGNLSPGVFLPIAEEIGIISEIGDWVLKQACLQLEEWKKEGIEGIRMAVNVAANQLRHGHIIDITEEVLLETSLIPGELELELTENILFQNAERTIMLLDNLKRLGVRIAVDDFGAGYSTLRHLASFPLDVLKVDRSFTFKLKSDANHAVIVAGIADMAKKLGLESVAEGVEDEEHINIFREYGYDIIQGFYYSRPVDADACKELLRNSHFIRSNP